MGLQPPPTAFRAGLPQPTRLRHAGHLTVRGTRASSGDTISVTDPAGGAITTATDALGRTTTSTDASGLTSATSYDDQNRPTSTTQSGTIAGSTQSFQTTYGYNATTGQLTSGHDEHAGNFTGSYDLNGGLLSQSWTDAAGGALTQTTLTDTAGTPTSKTWTQGSTTILSDSVNADGHGQIVTDSQHLPTLAATVAGSARDRRYGYDNAGRLTSAADTRQTPGAGTGGATAATQQCVVRGWAFGLNSNRTGEAATMPTAGACPAAGYTVPATSGTGATTHTYDTADQITDTVGGVATTYDPFGRTVATNGTTAGAPGTPKLTVLGYTVTDMAASQTLYTGVDSTTGVESSQTWALDPTGIRVASSTITTGSGPTATAVTKIYRYAGASDSPALIDEGDGTSSRPIAGIGGQMTATATIYTSASPKVAWQLTNLHGDVAATLDNTTGTAPTPTAAVDEYGATLDSPAALPAAGATPSRYNWLGAHQRSTENLTGLTLMGVRLYNPTTGRFLSTDPVPGGNANAYVYPTDPINNFDLDGRRWEAGGGGGGICGGTFTVPLLWSSGMGDRVGAFVAGGAVGAIAAWLGSIMHAKSSKAGSSDSAHGREQGEKRGISDDMAENAIRYGKRSQGKQKGTSVYTTGKVRVVVNDKTGKIITKTINR